MKKNTTIFQEAIEKYENFKRNNHYYDLSITALQNQLFPNKNSRYLANGLRDLHQNKNTAFANNLLSAIQSLDDQIENNNILCSKYDFLFQKLQNTPFLPHEREGTIGQYLMFFLFETENLFIADFKIRDQDEEGKSHDNMLFFNATRISKGLDKKREAVKVETHGIIMKNSGDKLIGHGISKYAGSDSFMETLAIADFGANFERNKCGLWTGLSVTNHRRLFAIRFVMVKISNDKIAEFEQHYPDLICHHKTNQLEENEVLKGILPEYSSIENILLRLNPDTTTQPSFFILDPYD